ncbi:hypothetical protein Vadar_024964 [Vaccinium darrowii]|uniref:Uncharacterized protein n=1 Tax=Vaccinium darrowii TaxID=229202 RepID=A0ACB7XL17_9ERIC|nr:hypothetical protein Vadar_024964 [Vaccinium darrowii]
MAHQQQSPLPPHVLIFPLPVQGHVNSMLKLAELLSLATVDVTFLLSEFSYRRLLRHTDIHSRFTRYPGFRFETISDGLPDDHPRAGERVKDIMPSLKKVTGPLFKEMMVATDCFRHDGRRPVTCIILDGFFTFAGEFALEKGIPLVYFRTVSACSFWACFCFQEIIEAGELPLKATDPPHGWIRPDVWLTDPPHVSLWRDSVRLSLRVESGGVVGKLQRWQWQCLGPDET